MDKEDKKRIKEFYDVELKENKNSPIGEVKLLYLNGNRVPCREDFDVFLVFGEKVENKEEARKKDKCIETNGKELNILFIEEIEKDERMEKWLKKEKQKIGLIDYNQGCDSGLGTFKDFEKLEEIDGYSNLTGSGNIDIGKDKKGNWVAQFTVRAGIDDFAIEWFVFEEKPTFEKVKESKAWIKIKEMYEKSLSNGDLTFQCWECGRKSHFVDITRGEGNTISIKEKLENYKEKYCGC